MAEEPLESAEADASEVRETDIVFVCPHCGKSLAIDCRGAGLTIACSDCGKPVPVPIPEGVDITDIDSSQDDQDNRIINLRRSLIAAEHRIATLEAEVEALISRREILERNRIDNIELIHRLHGPLKRLQGDVDAIVALLNDAVEPPESDSETSA